MQYTWGYIKEATLAKMDIDANDAIANGFIKRMHIYANEALTQICSAIKPKHTYVSFIVNRPIVAWNECVHEFGAYKDVKEPLLVRPTNLTDVQKLFWDAYDKLAKTNCPLNMPDDFIVFNDDIPIGICRGEQFELHDDNFRYIGDRHIMFYEPGIYNIPYNARWFFFTSITDNNTVLDIPLDICDALPSYIASQLFKIDDEVKAQIYRNEYEMFLSRIDDTNFKQTRTIKVSGGW